LQRVVGFVTASLSVPCFIAELEDGIAEHTLSVLKTPDSGDVIFE
jgi:hypothetical protein